MPLATFTLLHVVISLIGIGAGVIVVFGFLTNRRFDFWTAVYLLFTVLTSATGYLFPFEGFKPSYVIGGLSIVVLAIAIIARYVSKMAGAARKTYVITAIVAFYLNSFVLVFQSFLKIPALHALAPTQSEPPFAIAQIIVMAIFIVLGVLSVKRFRPAL